MSGPQVIEAAFSGALGEFALDVAFEAPMRGVTALFGPSGCGKTTVLRCAAGLQHLSGRLNVGGEVWQDDERCVFRRPHERSIGYVFQEASLFPHLSVRGNLLYGARRAAPESGAVRLSREHVIELLGIQGLLDRSPAALSGGERQRVAVGRALLTQPRLLLMDEPLAALDRRSKDEILPYLEELHEELSIPILYVSHDLAECERLADTLVLLDSGRVRAAGPLPDLEADPALPLLNAAGAAVVIEGRVTGIDEQWSLTGIDVPGGYLLVPGRIGEPGDIRRLRISASDVSFVRSPPGESTILNCLPARILSVTGYETGNAQVTVVAGLGGTGDGARIVSRITRKSLATMALAPGEPVFAQVKSVALAAR